MLTPEELIKQRNEIIQKKHELHVYLRSPENCRGISSRLHTNIIPEYRLAMNSFEGRSVCRRNSGKKDELRRCYHLAPGGVELQIRECNHALARIDSQLEALEKQGIAQKQQMELNCHGSEGAGNRLAEYAGLYGTPEGQQEQERSRDDGRGR